MSGWDQLKGILADGAREAEQEAEQLESALKCPECGWALEQAPNGSMWCGFDGYIAS